VLELDGEAGGGQVLRTALSLSLVAGRGFEMTNVRGSRPTPGLRAQHLACVEAAAALGDADVAGAELGSGTVTFEPSALVADPVSVDVGTAGSLTLLFDALLPVAPALPAPVTVTATGGTDVKWSPPFDALPRAKLPLLRRFGLEAAVDLDRRGFYPAGGGAATLSLAPSTLAPVSLLDRGPLRRVDVHAVASDGLADAEVAERGAAAATEALRAELDRDDGAAGDAAVGATTAYAETASPGFALVVVARYAETIACFDALGERGRPAEAVAGDAVAAFAAWRAGDAAVDVHLGDQLLPFVALAGGRLRLPAITDHVRTNADVLRAFGRDVRVTADGRAAVASAPVPE
jgi:RNA 3'-terminal phosphate cyclase (ATP)